MYILVYIKKFMYMKPNPKETNIILNILKGAQFEFLPRAPFYIDTPLSGYDVGWARFGCCEGEENTDCVQMDRDVRY
jgi:hypothetical protein